MCRSYEGDKRRTTGATEEEEKASQIPMDLYEEILVLLSIKDLLICKSVCKVWLKLISCPRFIQKHLYRSKTGSCNNGIRILIPTRSDIIDYYHYSHANTDNISRKIPYPLGFSGKDARILGSCDGLICLIDRKGCKLAMFNPSTRKSVTRIVDRISFKGLCFHWFGYHPSCGEYVVILGYFEMQEIKVVVNKFSRNLKPVLQCSIHHQGQFICWEKIPVVLHGNLHWPATRSSYNDHNRLCSVILKYDLHKDITVEIPVPGLWGCYFNIGVIDGCLFAISNQVNELWIMKEYGVEQSWTIYTNIEGGDDYSGVLSFLGFSSNIDGSSGSRLTKYSFRDREVARLMDYKTSGNSDPIVCLDTLVSPELIWGIK